MYSPGRWHVNSYSRLYHAAGIPGAGFQLQVDDRFGPVAEAFGHGGAGGSLHGAWPEQRIAFSYVPNLLRDDGQSSERAHSLLRALYGSFHAE
jgi:hypothetical protein